MSDLWPDIAPNSDSSNDGSSDYGRKYQENPDDQEQEEVVLFTHRKPRRLIQVDQRALRQIKSEIKSSKDKLFLIKNTAAGPTKSKWYLVQVYMDQSD